MNRQEIIDRYRAAFAAARQRITPRRVGLTVVLVSALCFVTVVCEAFVRGRLDSARDRLPSALYTRTVPWGSDGRRALPVAFGSVDGAPMEQRAPVRLADLPEHLSDAVLAVEDQRFYAHHGLDVRRIGGAIVANARALGIAEGGSTITQQLAKNLFLTADRTPVRKVREAALALALEARHDKAEILEAYLNEIYLGQDGGRAIHGVGAAARYYFGKDVKRVTLSEAAMLAGMIHAPNRHTPTRHPVAARARRNLVLALMAEQGRITHATATRASRAKLPTDPRSAVRLDGRFFRDFVAPALPKRLPSRGTAVYTTIDARLQVAAERALRTGLDRLKIAGAEAALVAIDPRTGEVLAMVGGRDYGRSQFNRAADARRQPGSAFKPIVALAALERAGDDAPAFTLASLVDDEPFRVELASGDWTPTNYDHAYRGPVTVRAAMEQSLNIPFARIGLTVGPTRIVAAARRLGITSPLDAVPSLALGSSDVTVLELVRAYGVLAAGGLLAPTQSIVAFGAYGTAKAPADAAVSTRVVDPAVAYLVTSTLQGVTSRGTGRALQNQWRLDGFAGKTGTSNNWRDAWFVAYSPSLVVGVWVGFDDGRSLAVSGGAAALPIVARFLRDATAISDTEDFEVPGGIEEGYASLTPGSWPGECGTREYFLEGTAPSGDGCVQFELPDWEALNDWREAIRRGAGRLIEELIVSQSGQGRTRRE